MNENDDRTPEQIYNDFLNESAEPEEDEEEFVDVRAIPSAVVPQGAERLTTITALKIEAAKRSAEFFGLRGPFRFPKMSVELARARAREDELWGNAGETVMCQYGNVIHGHNREPAGGTPTKPVYVLKQPDGTFLFDSHPHRHQHRAAARDEI